GAFAAPDTSRVPLRIDPNGLSSIEDVLEVMELRLAIEVEAAALAAERMTAHTLAPIANALRSIEVAIGKGESAIAEDFAFHRAIAAASGNPRFGELLQFLGGEVNTPPTNRVGLTTPHGRAKHHMR